MMRIAFIAAATGVPANDNHTRLPRAFAAAGWQVECLTHESIFLGRDGVCAADAAGRVSAIASFDRVWLIGFGTRIGFLDRMQMLKTLDQTRFVNAVDALVYLHGKFEFTDLQPETHASSDAGALMDIVASGGQWIAKPTAGSFGRDVFRLHADDANCRTVLDNLTGHGAGRYCLLQRYVPSAEQNEKRVIVAGNEIIGAYGKVGGNLTAGARARRSQLTEAEIELAMVVVERLLAKGVRFAGIDLAHPFVFEANVANPGGLQTLEALTGVDPTPAVVEALADY